MGQDFSQVLKIKDHFVGWKILRICSRHRPDGRGMSGSEHVVQWAGKDGSGKSGPAEFVLGVMGDKSEEVGDA